MRITGIQAYSGVSLQPQNNNGAEYSKLQLQSNVDSVGFGKKKKYDKDGNEIIKEKESGYFIIDKDTGEKAFISYDYGKGKSGKEEPLWEYDDSKYSR